MYTLTDAGEEYLQLWSRQLEQYQATLDRFFEIYRTERKEQQ
jgi:DNA-binding PadR family transcriptional regulator